MPEQSTKFRYRPEIDGLRAVSVVAVLLFHAEFGFTGGYVGVDVFFVISGFLITSLLLRDMKSQRFSLGDFWERRVRRIVPALAAVLIPTIIVGYLILLPADLVELGESTVAQALISANIYFWQDTGYFAGPAELKPLLHTWSLAVEEQFYLFFPIFLYWLHKKAPRQIGKVIVAIAIASLILNVFAISRYRSATFFLLPTRAWELMAGSILAIYPRSDRYFGKSVCEIGSLISLAMIGYATLFFTKTTLFPGWAAILPIAGAMGIIFFNSNQSTLTGKLLATKPFVFVGLISYSLYLWHWPILAYLRYAVNDCTPIVLAGGLAASFVLATVSYYYVEQPFRKRTLCETRKSAFATTFGYISVIVGIGLVFAYAAGFPNRFDARSQSYMTDAAHSGNEYETPIQSLNDTGFQRIGIETSEKEKVPDFVLVGDSHAMAVAKLFDQLAQKKQLQGAVATRNSTIPLPGVWSSFTRTKHVESNAWNNKVQDLIQETNVKNVILVAAWNIYLKGFVDEMVEVDPNLRSIEKRGFATNSSSLELNEENAYAAIEAGFRELLPLLERHGVNVWVVTQVPEANEDLIARRFMRSIEFPAINSPIPERGRSKSSYQERSDLQQRLCRFLESAPNVTIIDVTDAFFEDRENASHIHKGRPVYRDISHLSDSGAELMLSETFMELLDQVADSTERTLSLEEKALRGRKTNEN